MIPYMLYAQLFLQPRFISHSEQNLSQQQQTAYEFRGLPARTSQRTQQEYK